MDHNSDNLIDLKRFPGRVYNRRYMAVYSSLPYSFDNLFCLTPHVMRWSENTWLLDLHSCVNYWRQQSLKRGISLLELYGNILQKVFGNGVVAVCCDHPWQGLFFLNNLVDLGCSGIHDLNSLFSQRVYKSLGWEYWFALVYDLAGHLETIKARGSNASRLRPKIAQMQRFVQRLDLFGPYELQQAEVAAITRRYSGWLGKAWAWTFPPVMDTQSGRVPSDELHDFPWCPLKFNHSIQTSRHLDYPVSQWDVVEPLLKEDFSRLCQLDCWSRNDKINQLHWHITLFSLEQVEVIIRFRNPYSLHHDAPDFRAASYQAYYAYIDMMQALTLRDTDLDLPAEMPFISWKLEITECLHLPPVVLDLFAEDKTDINNERIMDLQNCLPETLEHYAIAPDFMPDQLFCHQPVGENHTYGFSLKQWSHVALARPLFYDPEPLLIDTMPNESVQFLERTANNWWKSDNMKDLVRDYFIVKDKQGRYLWVFRNSAGEWYRHGIYS